LQWKSAMKSVKGCLGEKKILLETLREGENARDRFFSPFGKQYTYRLESLY
jgi:hypothetical protein